MCVPASVEVREDWPSGPVTLSLLPSRKGLSLKLELATFWPDEMANKPQGYSFLCPNRSDVTDGRTHMVCPDFCAFLVFELRPSCLSRSPLLPVPPPHPDPI